MALNIKDFSKGNGIQPIPAGTYNAVCIAIADLGSNQTSWQGKDRTVDQFVIIFEIPDETIEINGEILPRNVSKIYTKSFGEKANLRKDLVAWRGREFTEAELNDFDLIKLIGVPCTLSISHRERNGKTYADISSISKAMKHNKHKASRRIYFDLQDKKTWGAIQDLPDWVVTRINQSNEAKNHGWVFTKNEVVPETGVEYGEYEDNEDNGDGGDYDTDIPF